MNRKTLIALLLLIPVALSTSAAKEVRLVRLTAVNKGHLPLGLYLKSQDSDLFYYLRVPGGGSKEYPVQQEFTIQPGNYSLRVDYIEYYDPVYGFQCSSSAMQLTIANNSRIVFLPCGQRPPNSGEPSQWKFWPVKIRRLRFPFPI